MELVIGVDVGKNQLDICYQNHSAQFDNTECGERELISHLRKLEKDGDRIVLIVCETTGGYERLMMKYLRKETLSVHVAHTNKIRYFAKTKGLLAKTDKIDAHLIAEYARVMDVKNDEVLLTENEIKLGKLI